MRRSLFAELRRHNVLHAGVPHMDPLRPFGPALSQPDAATPRVPGRANPSRLRARRTAIHHGVGP